MKPVFETTGTCLSIKLPSELDHPASDLIRKESDRIMGKIYVRTICFDFGDTVFMVAQELACLWDVIGPLECVPAV